MDAVEYLNEKARMCESYYSCDVCPFTKAGGRPMPMCPEWVNENPEQAVRIVEEWSATHQIQTRRDKFKEVFGVEPTNCHLMILDTPLAPTFCSQCEYESGGICNLDSHAWWDAPYEAPKGER